MTRRWIFCSAWWIIRASPEFHYFHQWQPGDMVLWDNWRAMHCATGVKPGVERVIHRTTIKGDATLGRVVDP